MGAVFNKLFVYMMNLVGVLAFHIVKKHELGYAETIVHNIALFRAGRDADTEAFDGFNFLERFQALNELVAIFF